MTAIQKLHIVVCLCVVVIFINGCAARTPTGVGTKTVGDSILDARESLALARGEEAQDYAPEEFARAESLLEKVQESLRRGKILEAMELAFRADVEAKIATAMTREAKARRRAEEAAESKQKIMLEAKIDEAAGAKARQAIAEEIALRAQEDAEEAKALADKEIDRSKVELAIARVEMEMDKADEAKASEYAEEPYGEAKALIQAARTALSNDDFQEAMNASQEASRYASNAYVQARAKLEAEMERSLRARDKSVAAMTKAEISMEKAKDALAGQYARDMYEKAKQLLQDVKLALEAKEYERAESLAEQAQVSASSAAAVAEAREIETRVKEAQEDAQANALDAVAKAERSIAEAQSAGAEELAADIYKRAQSALDRARQAALAEDFEAAASLAQESVSQSITALTMAEAKTERQRKIEEIETSIMEEAGGIPETTVRKTERGVTISMGGDLFAAGSSQIRNEVRDRLKTVAELLKKYPDYKVIIEGHTDNTGSEESNLKISSERAYNFLRHMVDEEGIPLERLSSVGYGESRPIASNINEAGRRQNRRVDIVILTAPVSP